MQEAYLALARQHQLPDEPLAWLVKVTRNQVLHWRRSDYRRANRQQLRAEQTNWLERVDSAADSARVDGAEVTEALRSLPTDLAEVVTMHIWGRLTFEQIAEVVGSSKSTVHRRYTAALDLLRNRLSCRIEDR